MKRIVITTIVLTTASPAFAQSATAQAESLFRQGRDLMNEGKLSEACAAFDASQKLEPAISTGLHEGECRERAGQYATAWGHFVDAERKSRTTGDASIERIHRIAVERAAKLEPRLSKLTVEVGSDRR